MTLAGFPVGLAACSDTDNQTDDGSVAPNGDGASDVRDKDAPDGEGGAGSDDSIEAEDAPEDDGTIVRDGSWARGLASGYCFEDNDGWDSTASGIPLDLTSYTVAVALDDGDLIGRDVEIVYEGMVLTARVTDVGGFGIYGRVLDLGPAVWATFGAENDDEWGVRQVGYRVL